MREYPRVIVTQEMLDEAMRLEKSIEVNRTKASQIDTLAGAIGEFVFAQWFLGDWKMHEVGLNKGNVDFKGVIEVKTSAFPFRESLNLLVREDYAAKRHPPFYVQVIIDTLDSKAKNIPIGTNAIVSGFARDAELAVAPLRDFGSKFGGHGGYKCRYIMIRDLHPMNEFRTAFDEFIKSSQ